MSKKINIDKERLMAATLVCTRTLFSKTGWRDVKTLSMIEYDIENAIKNCLQNHSENIKISA